MENLPELCNSDYKHQQQTRMIKEYYRSNDRSLILCSECLGVWCYQQAVLIASAIIQQFQAVEHKQEIIFRGSNTFKLAQTIKVIPWMRRIFKNPFDLKTTIEMRTSEFDENNFSSLYGDSTISLEMDTSMRFSYDMEIDWHSLSFHQSSILQKIAVPISEVLMSFIRSFMTRMTPEEIDLEMNKQIDHFKYHTVASGYTPGDCPCDKENDDSSENEMANISMLTHTCSTCGRALEVPFYIYHNQALCLQHMYEIVVQAAIRNNLSETCGLSLEGEPYKADYRLVDDSMFMMSVIDKYFNAVEGFDKVMKCYKVTFGNN